MLQILFLIVDTVAVFLTAAFLLRFWMQAIRVRPPAPLGQFTFQLSDWLVRPLRRVVPGVGGYDWASLIGGFLIVLLSCMVLMLVGASFQMVLLQAVHRLLSWIIIGFMILLGLEALLSWVNPQAPAAPFLRAVNEPLLRPLRRILPPIGGLDISVLVAMLLLQIMQILLGMVFDQA